MGRRMTLTGALALTVLGTVALGLLVQSLPARGVRIDAGTAPADAPPVSTEASFDRHFRLGVELMRQGLPADAGRMFEAAHLERPRVPEALVNLGFARFAEGRPDAAADAFQAAVSLNPFQANAYYGLGEAKAALGDLEAARGAMRTFLHLAPPDHPFHRRALSALWELEETPQEQPPTEQESQP